MAARRRVWLAALVGVVALVAAGVAIVRRMMNAPLFEPGTVAAGITQAGESLDPPTGPDADGPWQVTPTIALHRTSTGVGDDLLLVHGCPGYPPRTRWKATSLLAPSYPVHAYDQRGCGRSTRPLAPRALCAG